ncbi:MAG: hypothetical protein WEC33_01755 [Dehalococcoidia bacterium]
MNQNNPKAQQQPPQGQPKAQPGAGQQGQPQAQKQAPGAEQRPEAGGKAPHQKEQERDGPAQTGKDKHAERPEKAAQRS